MPRNLFLGGLLCILALLWFLLNGEDTPPVQAEPEASPTHVHQEGPVLPEGPAALTREPRTAETPAPESGHAEPPESGTVVVRVLGDLGEPIPDGYLIRLETFDGSEDDAEPTLATAMLQDGVCSFQGIAFDAALKIEARGHFDGSSQLMKESGPTAQQPVRHVDFRPFEGKKLYVGRVVNEEGMAGADRRFGYHIHTRVDQATSSRGSQFRTDEEGRFVIAVPDFDLENPEVRLLISMDRTAKHPPRQASSGWQPDWEEGRRELGDLVLEPLPILAEGVVHDPQGRPVVDANVRLHARNTVLTSLSAKTEQDGSFRIYGAPQEETWQWMVSAHRFMPFDGEMEPNRGMRIQLEPMLILQVPIALDPAIDLDRLRFVLVNLDLPENPSGLSLKDDVLTAACAEGRYRIEVRAKSTRELLHEGPEIILDGTIETLRATPIDLRGSLVSYHLTVDLEDGTLPQRLYFADQDGNLSISSGNPLIVVRRRGAGELAVGAKHDQLQVIQDFDLYTFVSLPGKREDYPEREAGW